MAKFPAHLVSMPGPPPLWPSVQLGSLKAYVDQELGSEVDLIPYSAHLTIMAIADTVEHFKTHEEHGEYVYGLLYLRRFVVQKKAELKELLTGVNRRFPAKDHLSWPTLDRLDKATKQLVEKIGRKTRAKGVNVVCFTLSYDQIYGSLYCARLLQERFPKRKFFFVYGGFRAGDPNTASVMRATEARGLVVRGEGERKLVTILRGVMELEAKEPDISPATLAERLAIPAEGIIDISSDHSFWTTDKRMYESQVRSLATLPIPNYDEYFESARPFMRTALEFELFKRRTPITLEGSRGCFGRCDFCNFPLGWGGFRSMPKNEVFTHTQTALRRYGSMRVIFADDASDTWAEAYAEEAIRQGVQYDGFLETRAHHSEEYWIKLGLAGMTMVQIGVEALTTRLLKAIHKDTRAIQNLVAHKVLTEMGVTSASNLITFHPRSTLEDVKETDRVLGYIGHLQPFSMSPYLLMFGSPLFDEVSTNERRLLLKASPVSRFPDRYYRYAVAWAFQCPRSLGPTPEVFRAWQKFAVRHNKRGKSDLDVERLGEHELIITRIVDKKVTTYKLEGDEARVYDACHAGLKLDRILEETGLAEAQVNAILDRLIAQRLTLKVDDFYLSLALRKREELIRRLYQRTERAAPTPMTEQKEELVSIRVGGAH